MKPNPATQRVDANGKSLPNNRCVNCGYEMDAATCLTDEQARPTSGDFSLCLKCGQLMRFNSELRFEAATLDQLHDDDQRFEVRRAQQHIRNLNR